MPNHSFRLIDRRGFLCFGALAAGLFAAGCDGGSGEPQQVKTAPTVKQGARSRLDALQQKTADAAAKAGKKK